MRSRAVLSAACVTLVLVSARPCFAQGSAFGLGGRMSMIRNDTQIDTDALRFFGGQLRARTSPRTGLELSIDYRNESNESETIKVRDIPIQASLLLFLAKSALSPFVLGGAGWYNHRVERLSGNTVLDAQSNREFGWHAGFGAELRAGNHMGIHGDYRYTFLSWNKEEDDPTIAGNRFLPKYKGSMWTAGLTIYF
jgi:opacity protein-like surface antigen